MITTSYVNAIMRVAQCDHVMIALRRMRHCIDNLNMGDRDTKRNNIGCMTVTRLLSNSQNVVFIAVTEVFIV